MPSGWLLIYCVEKRHDELPTRDVHPSVEGGMDCWELAVWELGVKDLTTRSVTVVNQLGLHARAAARFVHLATRFESRIRVGRESKVMDGKSIMGILLLAASRGTTLTVIAEGPDEDRAVDALVELVESGFGEESWNA